ncbi:LysM peptidoglycan-binding domain-containing protein [Candidatus Hydrogenedentota bacterium]
MTTGLQRYLGVIASLFLLTLGQACQTLSPSAPEVKDQTDRAERIRQYYDQGMREFSLGQSHAAEEAFANGLKELAAMDLDIDTHLDIADLYYNRMFAPKENGAYEAAEDIVFLEETVTVTEITEEPKLVVEEDAKPEEPVASVSYDIVIAKDQPEVQHQIKLWCAEGSKLQQGLDRMWQYLPEIKKMLKREGLPEDLAYLPLVESNFKTSARSRAGAVGMWQFMPLTAKQYGLNTNWRDAKWLDERKDWEMATMAAIQYLEYLHLIYDGSWEMALASYNCGENGLWSKRQSFVKKTGRPANFWDMASSHEYGLRRETRDYVPRFMAAVVIAKEPEKYGFKRNYADVEEREKIEVKGGGIDLGMIAKYCGVSLSKLRSLNPALKSWCTPMHRDSYWLVVPKGTKQKYDTEKLSKPTWKRYEIARGDSLSAIAKHFGTTVKSIKEANGMKSTRLIAGEMITIPVNPLFVTARKDKVEYSGPGHHTVRRGESLWDIARTYDVTVSSIRAWNDISKGQYIYPGQKLRISGSGTTPSKFKTSVGSVTRKHVVRKGDTLWDIAMENQVTVSRLRKANGLRNNNIKPGVTLTIPN